MTASPPLWSSFLSRLEDFLTLEQLRHSLDSVLLAVSGGVDSVVLMESFAALMHRMPIERMAVCYVDHGLRPEQTPQESAWVEARAHHLGLPFFSCKVDLQKKKGSIQDAARQARRAALESLAKQHTFSFIATGHHADDQAETILLRILRGTSPTGLMGILPLQGQWLHPLLPFSRKEIEEVALVLGLSWIEDPSNQTEKYTRNRLRLGLLPQLAENYNPNLAQHLCHLGQQVREDEAFFEEQLALHFREPLILQRDKVTSLDIPTWKQLPKALRWRCLRKVIRQLGRGDIERHHLKRLEDLAWTEDGEKKASLPQKIHVLKRYQKMIFGTHPIQDEVLSDFTCTIQGKGTYETPLGQLVVNVVSEEWELESPQGLFFEAFWESEVHTGSFSAILRNRRPGDRLHKAFGRQRFKKWCIDRKIPQSLRSHIPLFELDGLICWVVGFERLLPLTTEKPHRGWSLRFYPTHPCFEEVLPLSLQDTYGDLGSAQKKKHTKNS